MYKPIEYSYQVSRNVLAGEHPLFDLYKGSIKGNIPTLLKFGITVFLDLTQSYEVSECASFLPPNVQKDYRSRFGTVISRQVLNR